MKKKDRQDLHDCIDNFINYKLLTGETSFNFLVNINQASLTKLQDEGYKQQYPKSLLKSLTNKGKSD